MSDMGLASQYNPFVLQPDQFLPGSAVDITVRVSTGVTNLKDNLLQIFDSKESWQLFRNRDHYSLTLQPKGFPEPYLSACIDSGFTSVDLVFNERTLNRLGKSGHLPSNPIQYPLDQILIMHHMACHKKGILIHSAGMELDGKGYLFPGRSGAGKSTLARQLSGHSGFALFSDDRMIVRKIDDQFQAFGTPWPGEAGVAQNRSVPLAGLCFIHHAQENRLEHIDSTTAVERLLPVSSIPWYDRQAVINLLDFCGELTATVPAYDLHFRPSSELADFLPAALAVT